MTSLKDLRLRITSVKSTQKITSAMKMVATAKLRKAQERLDYGRLYFQHFEQCMAHALHSIDDLETKPPLLTGNPDGATFIIVLATDRGLCGGYNTSIVREVKALVKRTHRAKEATAPAKTHQIQMAVIGRKAKNTLKRECADGRIAASFCKSTDAATDAILQQGHVHDVSNTLIKAVVDEVVAGVESGKIGSVLVVTGRLHSIISQPIEVRQLVPLAADFQNSAEGRANGEQISIGQPPYTIFEPKLELLITQLLAYHLKVRLNTLHLENTACEHAARMSAMDNATRNARDMIQNLQLRYNQGRQAQITNELIEIISGSNAV